MKKIRILLCALALVTLIIFLYLKVNNSISNYISQSKSNVFYSKDGEVQVSIERIDYSIKSNSGDVIT